MSAPYIIVSCQKLSKLVENGQSYAKNNCDCFLRHGVDKSKYRVLFSFHDPAWFSLNFAGKCDSSAGFLTI